MAQPAPPLLAALLALTLPLAPVLLGGCREHERPPQEIRGDMTLGKTAIARYGCGSCHFIPGVPGAEGRAAQPLLGFAGRADIAGSAPNTYDNLVTWVQRPQDIAPRARMPSLNVSEKDARDIAAYLLSLKAE